MRSLIALLALPLASAFLPNLRDVRRGPPPALGLHYWNQINRRGGPCRLSNEEEIRIFEGEMRYELLEANRAGEMTDEQVAKGLERLDEQVVKLKQRRGVSDGGGSGKDSGMHVARLVGEHATWRWRQKEDELIVTVSLPPDTRGRDLQVDISRQSLCVTLPSGDEVLRGDFERPVRATETSWLVDDEQSGRVLQIVIPKTRPDRERTADGSFTESEPSMWGSIFKSEDTAAP